MDREKDGDLLETNFMHEKEGMKGQKETFPTSTTFTPSDQERRWNKRRGSSNSKRKMRRSVWGLSTSSSPTARLHFLLTELSDCTHN